MPRMEESDALVCFEFILLLIFSYLFPVIADELADLAAYYSIFRALDIFARGGTVREWARGV